jgi:formate hydrogenlyase subunit 6/NADH:ubiquinone oxidoreductase subunit I
MAPKKKRVEIMTNPESCVGCRLCQMRCSFQYTKQFSFSNARINIGWNAEQYRYDISFGEECVHCGLCIASCVYGALSIKGASMAG